MSVSRRQFMRLLRLRNLLMLTLIVILLYIVKMLANFDVDNQYTNQALEVLQVPQRFLSKKDYFVPTSLKKIDWHDYALINHERKRVGLGEHGYPAHLPKSDHEIEKKLYAVNGFNGALSDKIPLNRSLPDIRHHLCEKKLYIASLPTVSVVVPFHNEHWSTLLRTAYSALLRAPDTLLKEVFLVDDASTKDFLKDKLDDYLVKNMPKVKVVRLEKRSGLITARLAGAKLATADVLVFLDSHTEANVNWLPPLLEPIALNYRTVTCPFIDVIAYDTFEYRAQDEGARGAFDWEFFYKRLPVLPKDEENMPEPFESPVMAGGLFAISRKFFWELGGYDPGLDIWGGEQYELSFKIWQCGGRMVDTPCSRVGHIYRKFAPFPNPGHGDFVGKNYRRVAEVWMDEYAQHLYDRRPHYRKIDTGDISEQKALREKLKCKSFRWFMTQIAFDLTAKYPVKEPNPFAKGRVRPTTNTGLCLDAHHGQAMDKLLLKPCATSPDAEQEFIFSWHKDIRIKSRNFCWDLPDSAPKSPIRLFSCHLGGGNQLWRYHMDTKQIKHGGDDHCIEWNATDRDVYINRCDVTSAAQRWAIDTVDPDMMAKWSSMRTRVTGPVEDY
ncbi:N-acetylgalactosaminyltransferase 6-like isoform X2 [Trichoplusia ni]|nr:N-acetylgalactosaminyltransferase 6-like isoform X2 [Trichoplusia ni]XP_026747460.1 N-acetylgalactosaminyltransferase 6-like isoform X2 [Trichoplusia ni]